MRRFIMQPEARFVSDSTRTPLFSFSISAGLNRRYCHRRIGEITVRAVISIGFFEIGHSPENVEVCISISSYSSTVGNRRLRRDTCPRNILFNSLRPPHHCSSDDSKQQVRSMFPRKDESLVFGHVARRVANSFHPSNIHDASTFETREVLL